MTEGGHRRRARAYGRLSGAPLDQFRAEYLALVSAKVQQCAGLADVLREGYGQITVTVSLRNHEFASSYIRVDHSIRADDG